ncbi:T-complex protein 1 subunit zeta-2 [Physeter macrocephalus]|uniref:T-complex protein 1 subunit zeta-2 n=1 Tax=Physeter macrocephalus TaxID=9755 RepID=A0A9W2X4K5_PHYMC|nr:T-complex protein 1 subunit zeta-2 [Physeter catodon]
MAKEQLFRQKVLAQNSGYDLQETVVKVQVEHSESKQPVGIDLNTGEPMVAADAGVWDNYCVKKQLLHSCTVIATNVLLVDEIMRAEHRLRMRRLSGHGSRA